NVSRLLDSGWDTNIGVSATVGMRGSEPDYATRSDYTLDFATAPHDDAIIKSMRRAGEGYGLHFRIGSTVSSESPPRSDLEIASEAEALVKALPRAAFGRRPTRFPMMTDWAASDGTHTPGTLGTELR